MDSPPAPSLEKTIRKEVEFPDEDESMGQVMIAWSGPNVSFTLHYIPLLY